MSQLKSSPEVSTRKLVIGPLTLDFLYHYMYVTSSMEVRGVILHTVVPYMHDLCVKLSKDTLFYHSLEEDSVIRLGMCQQSDEGLCVF